jgi:hypothetical protein
MAFIIRKKKRRYSIDRGNKIGVIGTINIKFILQSAREILKPGRTTCLYIGAFRYLPAAYYANMSSSLFIPSKNFIEMAFGENKRVVKSDNQLQNLGGDYEGLNLLLNFFLYKRQDLVVKVETEITSI